LILFLLPLLLPLPLLPPLLLLPPILYYYDSFSTNAAPPANSNTADSASAGAIIENIIQLELENECLKRGKYGTICSIITTYATVYSSSSDE
jgi:hypothetical protein